MKYAGMAFQLFISMLIFLFLGKQLDAYFSFNKPYLTIFLPTIVLIGYLVKLVKELS